MADQSTACPICGIARKDQHTNRQSGQCDGIRNGYLVKVGDKIVPTGKEK